MNIENHTPTPWHVQAGTHIYYDDQSIALVESRNRESNAEFIVRACNSHAALVRAVGHVLDASEDGGTMNDIDFELLREALALAKT